MKQGEDLDIILNINSKSGDITMKIKLYPKELLEAAWKQDKKHKIKTIHKEELM